jgi:GNAT superfamily N-acetyltransferase
VKEFRIDAAAVQDVPEILGMIKELANYEKMSEWVVATEEGLRAALFGARPFAEAVLAKVDARGVGFALFFHNFSTFRGAPGLYLEDLYVRPQWRGRGYGRKLLAHLAALAVSRGCERMNWLVLDWNEPAIGFYRRAGATVADDWRLCRLTGDALDALAAEGGEEGNEEASVEPEK